MKQKVRILFILLLAFSRLELFSQPNWTPTDSSNIIGWVSIPYIDKTDTIDSISVLQPGDWIYIFSSDSAQICLASIEMSNQNIFAPLYANNQNSKEQIKYKVWNKEFNCIYDNVVAESLSFSDTLILTRLKTFPIEINYPISQICANSYQTLAPTISRNTGNILFTSIDVDVDSSYGTFNTSNIGLSKEHINITASSSYCLSQKSFSIIVTPSPEFTIEKNQYICPQRSIKLAPTDIRGDYLWLWNGSDTMAEKDVTKVGTYILEATNSFGCKHFDTIIVDFKPAPEFTIEQNLYLCPGSNLKIAPTNFKETFQWLWNDGDNSSEKVITQTGTYTLEATNNEGCTQKKAILVEPKIIAIENLETLIIDADCEQYGKIEIKNIMLQNGQTPYIITAHNTVNSKEYETENLSEGNYTLKVKDADGCETTYNRPISVHKNCLNDYPVISPNSNTKENNYFVPTEGLAKVYNRNGQLVSSFKVPAYWNGTDNNGQPVPMGIYLIFVGNNKPINITIIR